MIVLALVLQMSHPNVPPTRSQTTAIDLSRMAIEDAVQMMMQLVTKDAHDDVRDMLSQMDELRKQKSSMREAQNDMAKELERLRALSRSSHERASQSVLGGQVGWAARLPTICGQLTAEQRGRCLEDQVRARTAELRQIPTPR